MNIKKDIKRQFHYWLEKCGYHIVTNWEFYEYFDGEYDYHQTEEEAAETQDKYWLEHPNTVRVLYGVFQKENIPAPITVGELREKHRIGLMIPSDSVAFTGITPLGEDAVVNESNIEFVVRPMKYGE